jgi:hypothetical protein
MISWAHETIRFCLSVYARDTAKNEPSQTAALSMAHDLWDKAVAQSHGELNEAGLLYARLVLDWCALYRAK